MRSYRGARFLYSLMSLVGQLVIVFGIAVAAAGSFAAGSLWPLEPQLTLIGYIAGILPGAWISVYGFLLVAAVQDGRASVDTAEYTQQMLKIARDQLEISKQSLRLRPSAALHQGFAGVQDPHDRAVLNGSGYQTANRVGTNGAVVGSEPKPFTSSSIEGEPRVEGNIMTYKGQTAELILDEWRMNGIVFGSQEKLIAHIDQLALRKASAQTLRAER